ncbi:MAG: prepilin peptidase [Chakrabartia sp.]
MAGPYLARYLPQRIDDLDAAFENDLPAPPRAQSWQIAKAQLRFWSIEALALLAFPFFAWAYLLWTGPLTLAALAVLALAAALFVMIVIDARTQLLPDALTLPLLGLGLAANMLGSQGWRGVIPALVAGGLAYAGLRLMSWMFERRRGAEGMGQGDVKLITMLSLWLGLAASFGALFLACLIAIALKVVQWLVRRDSWREEFAFGPAIGAAALLLLALYATPKGCRAMMTSSLIAPATQAFCAR